jgi:hypothetical protein
MIHAKTIKLMITWHLTYSAFYEFVLKPYGIEHCCALGYVSEYCLSGGIKEKTCRRRSYLLNLKLYSKTADGKLSIDVHRVNSKICHTHEQKKLIQFTTACVVLMTSVAG